MKLAFCVVNRKELFEYSPDQLLAINTRKLELNLVNRHWYGFPAKKYHKDCRRNEFRKVINDIRLLRKMVLQKKENSLLKWRQDFTEEGFVLVPDEGHFKPDSVIHTPSALTI